ncbi:MAG TPA: hypothetical protein V6C69_01675 [Trichormus sp.]
MTRIERYEPPRGAATQRADLPVDMGSMRHRDQTTDTTPRAFPTADITSKLITFNPPGADATPQVAKAGDNTRSPLERVKAGLRDSPNPIGDIAHTLKGIDNLKSFHAASKVDGSHHVSIRLNHPSITPPPIGMRQGRHYPGVGYTDTSIEADVRHNGDTLTIDHIDGMHSKVNSDRLLPRRQAKLGPRQRDADTEKIEIGTDQNGHGVMKVDSDVILPILGSIKPTKSELRKDNLPPGPVRDLLADPEALRNVLKSASLFRPDKLRDYDLSQPRPGQFDITTTAQSARDVKIDQPIPDAAGATLESIHFDPTVKATLSTNNKDGQDSIDLTGVSGITFNIKTNAKPPLDKWIPPNISVTPKNLTLHTVEGKPVVSYDMEFPTGSGNIKHTDIPLSKLLEAQKESKEESDKKAKAQDAPCKTQDEYVQKYIAGRPGGFTADKYDDAYAAAQAAKKPLVIVFDRNNDPKTLQATADGVARGDAIYVYANVNKLNPDSWMSKYAQQNMTGQHEGALLLAQNLPNGSDKGGAYFTNGLGAGDIQWVANQKRR